MIAVAVIALMGIVSYWIYVAHSDETTSFVPSPADLKRSSWAWSAIFFAVGVFMCIYTSLGLVVETPPGPWLVLYLVILGSSIVSLWREPIRCALADMHVRGRSLTTPVELAILVVGSYLTFIAIEMPSNPDLTQFNLYGMLIEIVIVFLVMLALHMLFQRTGVGSALACVIFFVAGLAEYFVVEFKGTPIMASDVLALGTAATVSGDYTYSLNASVVGGLALALATILLLSLTPRPTHKTKHAALGNVAVSLAVVAVTVLGVTQINITDTWGIIVGGWAPLVSYYRQGFVTSFITSVQDLKPKAPEDYSNSSAKKTTSKLAATYDETIGASEQRQAAVAQYEQEKPTVIFVMNESFCDMSIYKQLGGAYTGPEWFNSYEGALMKGTLYVSPYGGGTCNTEFEFLTGCSTTFMGAGVYPYMVYDLSGVDNMGSELAAEGYSTTAMHPNRATNWNRDVVYSDMGFDQFLDIYEFAGSARLRGKVTDAATYSKILELLKSNDSPQFICDITMQNHSGYNTGLLPADMVKNYEVNGINDPELDEYLALVDESDQALEDFIENISKLDRKVVVVFIGDHQPKIAATYNDLLYPDEDINSIEHIERERQTVYMVYANYDVAGVDSLNDTSATSTNYLGAQVLNLIGAPLTDFQKAQLVLSEDLPCVNLSGYQDADGTWYEADNETSGAAAFRNKLWAAQYYDMFDDGVTYQTGSGVAGIL